MQFKLDMLVPRYFHPLLEEVMYSHFLTSQRRAAGFLMDFYMADTALSSPEHQPEIDQQVQVSGQIDRDLQYIRITNISNLTAAKLQYIHKYILYIYIYVYTHYYSFINTTLLYSCYTLHCSTLLQLTFSKQGSWLRISEFCVFVKLRHSISPRVRCISTRPSAEVTVIVGISSGSSSSNSSSNSSSDQWQQGQQTLNHIKNKNQPKQSIIDHYTIHHYVSHPLTLQYILDLVAQYRVDDLRRLLLWNQLHTRILK